LCALRSGLASCPSSIAAATPLPQNRSGFQFLNAVGDDGYNYDNSYFGAAVIDFQKETESGTRWRDRLFKRPFFSQNTPRNTPRRAL